MAARGTPRRRSPQLGATHADTNSTKQAWDSIAAAHIGVNHIHRATLQRLRQDWDRLSFRPGEQVDNFALWLSSLMQQMAYHGDEDHTEARAVKYMCVVPKKYSQIALAMKTLNFEELTIEEVTGRLKAVDNRKEAPPTELVSIGGKLLYTEEQWLARQEKGEGTSTSKERQCRPHSGKKGKAKADRSDDGGDRGRADAAAGEHKADHNDTCLNCGDTDHWAKECRQPRREHDGAAHVAQVEEPALFLAHGFLEFCTLPAIADLHFDELYTRDFHGSTALALPVPQQRHHTPHDRPS